MNPSNLPASSVLQPSAAASPLVEIHHRADQLPSDALDLMNRCAHDNLAFGPAWMSNLERTVFAGHTGVRYFTLRAANAEVLAVLPLLLERRRWSAQASALGNWYTALYEPALLETVSAQALVPLIAAVRRECPLGLQSVTLAPMDPSRPAFAVLETALRLGGFKTFRFFRFGNWYLQPPQAWDAYLGSRESKLRNTLKRMKQKLAAEAAQIEVITQVADIERGLAAYEAVYAKSWKQDEPSPGFIPGLIGLCAEQKILRLGVVWLKGQPIAAQLWYVTGSRAEIYKLAYDEAFKAYSPGTVLTAHLMQHVFEQDKVTEVDYLIGDDPYKKSWMSDRRERWGLVAYNMHALQGWAGWLTELAGRQGASALNRWRLWRASKLASKQLVSAKTDSKGTDAT